jgi:hypothetical protein
MNSTLIILNIFFGGLECVGWPLFCLCCLFCIFERCLDSNPESCRSKQVHYQLSHQIPAKNILLMHKPEMKSIRFPNNDEKKLYSQ